MMAPDRVSLEDGLSGGGLSASEMPSRALLLRKFNVGSIWTFTNI
jgi:hypothetical protein